MTETLIIALITALSSSGACSVILYLLQRRDKKKEKPHLDMTAMKDSLDKQSRVLLGIGHDRICYLGGTYIARGWITQDEYENLHDYIYLPYKEIGGDGSADRVMREVDKLPPRKPGREKEA